MKMESPFILLLPAAIDELCKDWLAAGLDFNHHKNWISPYSPFLLVKEDDGNLRVDEASMSKLYIFQNYLHAQTIT